jgi:hypothetical protein
MLCKSNSGQLAICVLSVGWQREQSAPSSDTTVCARGNNIRSRGGGGGRGTMAGSSWLKVVVLVVLTVQTSVFHLVLRLSRSGGATRYSPLAAVVSPPCVGRAASIRTRMP